MNNTYVKISLTILVLLALSLLAVSCSSLKDIEEDNSQFYDGNIIVGKITAVNGNQISLDIFTKNSGISDKTVLTITDDTIMNGNLVYPIEIGYVLTFETTGIVLESYPTQTYAKKIIAIDLDTMTTEEREDLNQDIFMDRKPEITIALLSDMIEPIKIASNSFFIVEISENPSTGYIWKVADSSDIDYVGSEFNSEDNSGGLLGAGGIRTFGFETVEAGEYVLTFNLFSPVQKLSETRILYVLVK